MTGRSSLSGRILLVSGTGVLAITCAMLLGLSVGPSHYQGTETLRALLSGSPDTALTAILWEIRLPRVFLAAMVGATLSLGGLVFQALLRNPLAEPYILGVSGGSAVGAVIGILLGLSRFPGVGATAFVGSMATLGLVLFLSSGGQRLRKDTLLLAGVMVNAFCSAVILFFLSVSQEQGLRNILFWLMGDFSLTSLSQAGGLLLMLLPCFLVLFALSHPMNLLLMGRDAARSMGVRVGTVTIVLLVTTSFMVSAAVAHSGLMGFVGLVIPHMLRLVLGPDHRVLVPACVFGGGAYLVLCDVLARTLPGQGEMPVGVITAMIGAPVFILLLRRGQSG